MMSGMALTRRAFCKLTGLFCLGGSFVIPHKLVAYEKGNTRKRKGGDSMRLPDPVVDGTKSLEMTIHQRRTIRSFRDETLTLQQFAQLLWAAQGVTDPGGFKRSAPSAGALYPMDIYAVVGEDGVEGLKPGLYLYDPAVHSVSLVHRGDIRRHIATASWRQMWMSCAPISFIITAEYRRITGKYGRRGVRYAMIEAGHIGQNIFLQSQAMGLAAGIVGAFEDHEIIRVMGIKDNREPLLIMPVGYKQ